MYLKERIIVSSQSPSNTNTIKVVEKGEPAFFGPSAVRLKHENDHFDATIGNDGATLDSSNIEVIWKNNDEATIILDGFRTAIQF